MPGPTRSDTWEVHVECQDVRNAAKPYIDLGIWDKKTGGQGDSEESSYSPGGMAPVVSLGGKQTIENVTISRLYRHQNVHQRMTAMLFAGRGRAKMIIKQIPLDIDGNTDPASKPIVWRGTLKRVQVPDVDSEANDAALLEVEMTPEGSIVVA